MGNTKIKDLPDRIREIVLNEYDENRSCFWWGSGNEMNLEEDLDYNIDWESSRQWHYARDSYRNNWDDSSLKKWYDKNILKFNYLSKYKIL